MQPRSKGRFASLPIEERLNSLTERRSKMSKVEQRLFFFFLRRWCLKNDQTISMPNGVVCLLRDMPYDVKIKKDTSIRSKP